MSRHRVRPSVAAVFVVGLVLLTSLSGAAVGPAAATEPSADYTCADRPLDLEPSVGAEVPETGLTPGVDRPVRATGPTQNALTPASTVLGGDLVTLTDVDDGLSRVELPNRGVGGSLTGPSGLVVLAGYSRFSDSDPLSHSLRTELYDAIAESPGTYPSALTDRLDAPRSTLRYHLRVLEESDLVSATAVDGRRRYVTTETDAAERALAVVDEGTTAAAIVERLGRDGAATVGDLAASVDRSPATVSYHLDRLEDAGVVERARDGQTVRNRLTEEVRPLVTSVVVSASEPYGVATDD